MTFVDRAAAGRLLGGALQHYAKRGDVVVFGLPRGGVPVAFEVARSMGAPLDVFVVRKLGTPGQPELAMGAIASGGVRVLNASVVKDLFITDEELDSATRRETAELHRREHAYRGDRPFPDLKGKTVILVDDGLATGSTMRAAIQAMRLHEPARIVVAVPIASSHAYLDSFPLVEELVCLDTPEPFTSVGTWYRHFDQTSDDEVRELLAMRSELA